MDLFFYKQLNNVKGIIKYYMYDFDLNVLYSEVERGNVGMFFGFLNVQ